MFFIKLSKMVEAPNVCALNKVPFDIVSIFKKLHIR